jgi:hypothetical protein
VNDLEFEWREYHHDTAIHESAHALTIYVCGGHVNAIVLMPASEFGNLLNGYVDHDRDRLSKSDQLVVHVAGEIVSAKFSARQPDFRSYHDGDDMAKAAANVREYLGVPIRDYVSTYYFQSAVAKAKSILEQYSLALTSLRLRLTRPPFKIDGATFSQIMERCGVHKV